MSSSEKEAQRNACVATLVGGGAALLCGALMKDFNLFSYFSTTLMFVGSIVSIAAAITWGGL